MRLGTGWPGGDRNYVGAQPHDLPLIKADLAVAIAEYPTANKRDHTEPLIQQQSLRGSASSLGTGWVHRLLPSRKEKHPVLTGIDTYPGYGWISFLACNTFAKTTISGLLSSRYHTHSSDQGSNFTANTTWPWVRAH